MADIPKTLLGIEKYSLLCLFAVFTQRVFIMFSRFPARTTDFVFLYSAVDKEAGEAFTSIFLFFLWYMAASWTS